MIDDGRFKRFRREFQHRDPDDAIGPYVVLSVVDTETDYFGQHVCPLWELDMASFDLAELCYSIIIDDLKLAASKQGTA